MENNEPVRLALSLLISPIMQFKKMTYGIRCLTIGVFIIMSGIEVKAHDWRVQQIPNGQVFGCLNCHYSPSGGGPRNPFGSAVEARVPKGSHIGFWDATLAALDSDGDGFSNGEELGDPDGDGMPEINATVTNPGDAASFPEPQSNSAPVLGAIGIQSVNEGELLAFAASASDPDEPAQTLTFSLAEGAPEGAVIDPSSGEFTWTPTESQGPGTYPIKVIVTDDGDPVMSDFEYIDVSVKEVNLPPVLTIETPSQQIDEETTLTFTVEGADPDVPAQDLIFSLGADSPAGVAIDPSSGVFAWTPTEAQGPETYSVTINVSEDSPDALMDTKTVEIIVDEVNDAPVISEISPKTLDSGGSLSFSVSASDSDLPAQSLTFSLSNDSPQGALIDPGTGDFSWTPTADQFPGVYTVTVQVQDDTSNPLSASQSFEVTLNDTTQTTLTINSISMDASGSLTLSWSASSGQTYRVDYKDNLGEPWQTLQEAPATSDTASLTLQPDASLLQRFYRVVMVNN